MKNKPSLFLLFLFVSINSSFSQGIIAGQVSTNMIYYDFPDDTLQSDPAGHSAPTADSILIDINQDGIFDIRFSSGKSTYLGGSFNSGSITIINQQGAIYTQMDSLLHFNQLYTTRGAKPFNLNDSIVGTSYNYSEYLWSANSSNQGPITYFHLWDSLRDQFIGFNIYVNNQLYFGWIRGEMYSHAAGVFAEAFIIKDLAFQSFPVGIEEKIKNNYSIYPNPVKNQLNIIGLENDNKSIQIIDITGKVILERNISGNKLDISHLASGIYFIKIPNGKGFDIKKIVKE